MKKILILSFLIFLIAAGCKTSKAGCDGANGSGPKFKASKKGFDWYKS